MIKGVVIVFRFIVILSRQRSLFNHAVAVRVATTTTSTTLITLVISSIIIAHMRQTGELLFFVDV
jgi:hypothetical protein